MDDNTKELFRAISRGDATAVREAIARGANVNAQDEGGLKHTPLYRARHRPEMIALLVDSGADVNSRMIMDRTVLHDAAERGDTDAMRNMIAVGADVKARDMSRSTPLHLAVENRHVEATKLLIARGADVNARGNRETTPLCEARDPDTAYELLKAGADPDMKVETRLGTARNEANACLSEFGFEKNALARIERQVASEAMTQNIESAMPGDMSAEMANYGKPEPNQSLTQLRPGELLDLGEQAGGRRLNLDSPEIL